MKMRPAQELFRENKKFHFTLIDPEDQTPEEAGKIAKMCEGYGTDAIMIGGSTITDREIVYDVVEAIKKNVKIPTISFPNSEKSVSKNVDYIFFMVLLNSREYRHLMGEQYTAVPFLKKCGIKPISMGYLIISTNDKPTTVEKVVADMDRISGGDIEKAVNYATVADFLGMDCVYLDAGSGAEKTVSDDMIGAVRSAITIPLIVGGGISDRKTAREKIDAGADIIVTGTLAEKDPTKIREIVEEIKS